jgi:hypothetical protein
MSLARIVHASDVPCRDGGTTGIGSNRSAACVERAVTARAARCRPPLDHRRQNRARGPGLRDSRARSETPFAVPGTEDTSPTDVLRQVFDAVRRSLVPVRSTCSATPRQRRLGSHRARLPRDDLRLPVALKDTSGRHLQPTFQRRAPRPLLASGGGTTSESSSSRCTTRFARLPRRATEIVHLPLLGERRSSDASRRRTGRRLSPLDAREAKTTFPFTT